MNEAVKTHGGSAEPPRPVPKPSEQESLAAFLRPPQKDSENPLLSDVRLKKRRFPRPERSIISQKPKPFVG